jgi:hypothetical protein
MRFTILITAAFSVLAFASQSASARPVQDSHEDQVSFQKRETTGLTDSGIVGAEGAFNDGG